MKAIICYLTFSGNTQETAEIIKEELTKRNINTAMYEIGFGQIPSLDSYDYIFFGSFTWEQGSTPDEMKDFVAELGYKPSNVHIFGSGDTQFGGDDLFCAAASKLAKFYNTNSEPLKIEQSPRGRQEQTIIKWVDEITKEI